MPDDTILAYDLGTGGNKASLYDREGQCLASVFDAYDTLYPGGGRHEQRPTDWWESTVRSTRRLMNQAGPRRIRAIAVSGHSLGCVPLDADGRLLRDATPIWSDARAGEQAERFFQRCEATNWYRLTGNGFPPAHYTALKVMWFRDHEGEMFDRADKIIGTKDYVNYRLTGRIATDYSYASGTGVYDLRGWDYSDALLSAADLPRDLLPEIVPSTEILGPLSAQAAEELGLPSGVPVACGGVDNSCMALGARSLEEGALYMSLGSSMWIAVASAEPVLDDRSKPYVFTHVVPGMFASAVAIFSGGSSLRWVRDHLCGNLTAQARADGADPYELMTALAEQSPPGARDLLFNPSLAGGSSLEPSPNIRGALLGLDLGHTQADVVRATLEGIALNLRLVLDELRRLTDVVGRCSPSVGDEMIVVGGGSRSPLWRQILADALQVNIVKTNVGQDAGSLGAAAVAAVGSGMWDDFQPIHRAHKFESIARPNPKTTPVYERLLPVFREAAQSQARLGDMRGRVKSEE